MAPGNRPHRLRRLAHGRCVGRWWAPGESGRGAFPGRPGRRVAELSRRWTRRGRAGGGRRQSYSPGAAQAKADASVAAAGPAGRPGARRTRSLAGRRVAWLAVERAHGPDEVGVGPWPGDWPSGEWFDPELLAQGDRRNVVDRYRCWRHEAIVADLDLRRHDFHVAIENWQHNLNIGTVVRNANAFLAAEVHVVGRRRCNRRGGMVTDRYQHVRHHSSIDELVVWAAAADLPLVGIDNLPGAKPLESVHLPRRLVLLFGQEGPGLSDQARQACAEVYSIAQYGSTRSINAGVASGIAMHAWIRAHAEPPPG